MLGGSSPRLHHLQPTQALNTTKSPNPNSSLHFFLHPFIRRLTSSARRFLSAPPPAATNHPLSVPLQEQDFTSHPIMETSPMPPDSSDRREKLHGELANHLSSCSLRQLAERLCMALIRLFNREDINKAYPELKPCYQDEIVDTVCSKFEKSIELVISKLAEFFGDFLFEVKYCIPCSESSQNKDYPCTCQEHQKSISRFEEELNSEISKGFGHQLFFSSWVKENGIEPEEYGQCHRMQLSFSNLLPVFESLMLFVVWYLINTELNSHLQKGGKALETETEFLDRSKLDANLKLITYQLLDKVLKHSPELLKIKGKVSDLQDGVQSLVAEHFREAMVSPFVSISNSEPCGSGFVLDGHILTSYHVIRGASDLKVTFDDGYTCNVELVGFYEDKDIAVLKIAGLHGREKNLRPLSCGDSSKLQLGESVHTIGNPFGRYPGSITRGTISAFGRDIWLDDLVWPIQDAIQIDANINPGNSGGPLLNSEGKLIGMITSIPWTSSEASCGIAFVIPVNMVVHTVHQLLSGDGKVEQPCLGICCEPELSVEIENLRKKGVPFKEACKEGPADRAGLLPTTYNPDGNNIRIKVGDIITSLNEKGVTNGEELFKILDKCKIGDEVTLRILRGDFEEITSGHGKKRKRGRRKKMAIHDHTKKTIRVKLESKSKLEEIKIRVKLESKSKLKENANGKWSANYI